MHTTSWPPGVQDCHFVITVYYSATWPPGVRRLSRTYLNDPFHVYVGSLDLRVSIRQLGRLVGTRDTISAIPC